MKFKLGTYNESMEAPTPICIYFSINISIFLTIILNEFVSLKMSCWLPRDILRLTKRSNCIWLCFSITSVQLILPLKQINIEGTLRISEEKPTCKQKKLQKNVRSVVLPVFHTYVKIELHITATSYSTYLSKPATPSPKYKEENTAIFSFSCVTLHPYEMTTKFGHQRNCLRTRFQTVFQPLLKHICSS